MSTTHYVKSWLHLYRAAICGLKTHDIRDMNERNYRVDDILVLQEYDPTQGAYTGRETWFRITYITSNVTPCAFSSAVLKDGYGILSISKV